MASIKKLFKHQPIQEQNDMQEFAGAVLTDLNSLNAVIVSITGLLDVDTGVNTTTYGTTSAALQTAALEA